MPKPLPVQRFRISCEVDVANLGPVLVQLAQIADLTVTGSEVVTDVRTYKQQRKTGHTVKAEDFLTEWLADHPTFRALDIIQHFRADGRTDGAGYTALRTLLEKKLLKKLGPGQYSRADVKHLPAPKKKTKPKKQHDVPAHAFTLRAASRNHGRFNSHWLKRQFEADGRHPSGTGPVINRLLNDKAIKRVGDGEYVLLQKTKPVKKTNSGIAPEAGVAGNG